MPLPRQVLIALLLLMAPSIGSGSPLASLFEHDSSLTPVSLQLLWYHQFQSAGYYAALAKGLYRDAGLQVEIRSGGYDDKGHAADPIEEVVAGRADFGISRSDLLIHHSQGMPVVVVANILQRSPLIFLTLQRYGFSRLEDIGSRPVSLTLPTLDTDSRLSAETLTALQRAGIDYHKLDNAAPSWRLSDLYSGKTQLMPAYLTDAPYFVRQHGESPVEIRPIDYGIDFYGETIFTSRSLLEEHPQIVQAFRQASLKGWQYALTHREEIVDLILEEYGTRGPAYDRDFLLYEAQRLAELMHPELIEIGYTNRKRWEGIAAIYQQLGMIETYDLNSFLEAAVPPPPSHLPLKAWVIPGSATLIIIVCAAGYLFMANRHLAVEVVRRKDTERQLKRQAEQDGLTGLANRRRFQAIYHKEVARAHRSGHPLSLIVFDVDHFKQVNDTYGHLAGDQVLVGIANVTLALLQDTHCFARYGGEEFALLLPDTGLDEARQLANRILQANREHAVVSGPHTIRYTLSIGIAELTDSDTATNDLIRRADHFLYQAKHAGRDAMCC